MSETYKINDKSKDIIQQILDTSDICFVGDDSDSVIEEGLRMLLECTIADRLLQEYKAEDSGYLGKYSMSDLDIIFRGVKFDAEVIGANKTRMILRLIDLTYLDTKAKDFDDKDKENHVTDIINIPIPKGKYMPKKYYAGQLLKNIGIDIVPTKYGNPVASMMRYKKHGSK